MIMKIELRQLRSLIREALNVTFKFELFHTIRSIVEQRAYLEAHTRFLGAGEGRAVYDIGNELVVKIALSDDERDLRQNAAEVWIYKRDPAAPIPKVYQYATDFRWIIVDRVTPIMGAHLDSAIQREYEDVNTLRQLKFAIIAGMTDVRFAASRTLHEDALRLHEEMYKHNGAYRRLFDLVYKHDISVDAELHDGNWGLTADGELVLLDVGT